MKIAVAADHAGVVLKDELRAKLEQDGHQVIDVGTHARDSVDYPDFARSAATELVAGKADRAILVCGTGVGMAMTANRVAGVRAVNCTDLYTVRMARAHNDANVLALGARVVGSGLAEELVSAFLETPFEQDRHVRRVAKIEQPAGGSDPGSD